jgi:hypothetical protein
LKAYRSGAAALVVFAILSGMFLANPALAVGFSGAEHIGLNSTVSGKLQTSGSVNLYQINLSEPGKVILTFSHDKTENDNNQWKVQIFTTGEVEIESFVSRGNNLSIPSRNLYLGRGIYYIRVQDDSALFFKPIAYSLTVSFEENTGQYEIEPNNSKATATRIKEFGKEIVGNLNTGADVDYYKIELPGDGKVSFTFDHGNTESNNNQWKVQMFTTDDVEIESFISRGTNISIPSKDLYLRQGTYFIRVQDNNADYSVPVDYSLTVEFEKINAPPPLDPSNVSDWAKAEVEKAWSMRLIPDSLMDKDLTKPISRAEFAAVSVMAYESLSGLTAVPVAVNPFTDTQDAEVLKAYNIGLTAGTSATTFSPAAMLTREQAATMLTRVIKKLTLPGWTLADDDAFVLQYTKPAPFDDDAQISSWAKDSVYYMAANDIIKGVGNNKFAPRSTTGYANTTREQAIIIVVRMAENPQLFSNP